MKFNPLNHPICFEAPLRLQGALPWAEHIPFAMYLISAFTPKTVVELGTYTGNSYCAFCQAVKTNCLDTKCYAIDTWKVDEHLGFYDDEIYIELSEYHDLLYSAFSRLLRMTFDDALSYFSDGSIDLLHINGSHTYDAVKHDFENWRPKLNDGAIVLFHDINVREREFGVWKFWEELKQEFQWFEFFHGNGLGVISISERHDDDISNLFLANEVEAKIICRLFSILGQNVLRIKQEEENEELNRSIRKLDSLVKLANDQINDLQFEVANYTTSISWKITRPLRKMSNFIRRKWPL